MILVLVTNLRFLMTPFATVGLGALIVMTMVGLATVKMYPIGKI